MLDTSDKDCHSTVKNGANCQDLAKSSGPQQDALQHPRNTARVPYP
jgi:hypothetical protein